METILAENRQLAVMMFRFLLNLLVAYVAVYRLYLKQSEKREYLFTFVIFNALIFFVASLLESVKLKTGFAFGLFAIFSFLRYRTEQIGIKEMTFLFISIILAVINSLITQNVPVTTILFADAVIVLLSIVMVIKWLGNTQSTMTIVYENIGLIHLGSRRKLQKDLEERTGLAIDQIVINKCNFLRDSAEITLYYRSPMEGLGYEENDTADYSDGVAYPCRD